MASEDASRSIFTVEKPHYALKLPYSWEEVSPSLFLSKYPMVDAAFRKKESVDGVYPSLVITRERLPRLTTPLAYGQEGMEGNAAEYLAFTLLHEELFTIGEQSTKLYVFQAKQELDGPTRKFWQVYVVQDGSGSVITVSAALSDNANTDQEIRNILSSFSFVVKE